MTEDIQNQSTSTAPDLIPASMLAAYAYCPRLSYLQWVQGEFQDSAETVEGRHLHRWIDAEEDPIPEDFQPFHARSVSLSAPQAGVCCRIDLLEGDGSHVTPVEYKRGETRKGPAGPGIFEPHLIQLAAQCLALRENGFSCNEGMVYYIRSQERVPVKFDRQLLDRTLSLLADMRRAVQRGELPPPLENSQRCDRCSMAGICLPDEVNLLREMDAEKEQNQESNPEERIRMLLASRDDQVPLYVVGQGKTVRKRGERLEVWSYEEGKISEARIREISKVCLYGSAEITTPAMVELMQRNVPVLHFTHGGWFQGIALGMSHKNVQLRIQQFRWAEKEERSLAIARKIVSGKIENCRVLLSRNDKEIPGEVLESLKRLAAQAEGASQMQSLLGFEGAAAEVYFGRFGNMLKSSQNFSFQNRNKRPPKDPVNSVLSYLYGVLAKELFSTVLAAGFDPYLGFYHQPRYGRPALALDMMEEFRPVIADSSALTLFNKEELAGNDFIRTGIGISLTPDARRKVIAGYERRMQSEVVHPIFGYRLSYRRILEVQARLLARVLSGEIKEYPAFVTR